MAAFKTLAFTDEREKRLGTYVIIDGLELFGSNVPELRPMSANMNDIQSLNPKIDFTGIKLITIRTRHVL